MSIIGSLVIVALHLGGCSWQSAPMSAAQTTSKVEDSTAEKTAQVCYPGSHAAGPRCFQTTPAKSITENGYAYRDPYTDPRFPKNFNRAQYAMPQAFMALKKADQSYPISEHFFLADYMRMSSDRGPWALYSSLVVGLIEKMRTAIGRAMYITSGFRSPGTNSDTSGSADWSRHMYGDAIDFYVPGVRYQDLARHCLTNGAAFYQLYADHIHCDWRTQALDPAFFGSNQQAKDFVARSDGGFAETLQIVAQESRFLVNQVQAPNGEIYRSLTISVPQEDEGDLLRQWWVLTQSGSPSYFEGPSLRLDSFSGVIEVYALVGGNIEIREKINTER